MAKRRRLEVPETVSPGLETKSAPAPRARMPIADVAGEAAGRAALEEVAREMTTAEEEGRVIKKLPIDRIERHHLSRDRMVFDPEEMAALEASIRTRGQQTPIEVLRNGSEYGLISGLRRIEVLRRLGETHVLALVKSPESSQAAYQAMIEENEIRADLSLYERANIAAAAAEQGVYGTPRAAVAGLFSHASASKRSKIARFLVLREMLGRSLRFPAAISEKLGLALANALEADPALAGRIAEALRKTPPEDAAGERRALERALKKTGAVRKPVPEPLGRGLKGTFQPGRVVVSGAALTEEMCEALREFLVSHAKERR